MGPGAETLSERSHISAGATMLYNQLPPNTRQTRLIYNFKSVSGGVCRGVSFCSFCRSSSLSAPPPSPLSSSVSSSMASSVSTRSLGDRERSDIVVIAKSPITSPNTTTTAIVNAFSQDNDGGLDGGRGGLDGGGGSGDGGG
eukprot:3085119-Prymnesium_polylepis.1